MREPPEGASVPKTTGAHDTVSRGTSPQRQRSAAPTLLPTPLLVGMKRAWLPAVHLKHSAEDLWAPRATRAREIAYLLQIGLHRQPCTAVLTAAHMGGC